MRTDSRIVRQPSSFWQYLSFGLQSTAPSLSQRLNYAMKSLFPGHFPPNISFEEILPKAVIVFDTNVLINLYGFGPRTRASTFEALRKVAAQCWLPYQVALEFHRTRIGRVERGLRNHDDAVKQMESLISDFVTTVESQDVLKHDPQAARRVATLKRNATSLVSYARQARTQLPQSSSEDPVLEFVAEIFHGRVGAFPDQDKVEIINKEGTRRFASKHPPGFTDEKEKEKIKYMDRGTTYEAKFGDLYIWKQILEHVASDKEHKHLIFVTDEEKPDWWAKSGSSTIGPAPALSQELALHAEGWSLRMYRSPRFFKHLAKAVGTELSEEQLAEINEASLTTNRGNPNDSPSSQGYFEIFNPSENEAIYAAYIRWLRWAHGKPDAAVTWDPLPHGGIRYRIGGFLYFVFPVAAWSVLHESDLSELVRICISSLGDDKSTWVLALDTTNGDLSSRTHLITTTKIIKKDNFPSFHSIFVTHFDGNHINATRVS